MIKKIVSTYIHIDIKKVKNNLHTLLLFLSHTHVHFHSFQVTEIHTPVSLNLTFFILSSCYDVDLLAVIGVFSLMSELSIFYEACLKIGRCLMDWVCVIDGQQVWQGIFCKIWTQKVRTYIQGCFVGGLGWGNPWLSKNFMNMREFLHENFAEQMVILLNCPKQWRK